MISLFLSMASMIREKIFVHFLLILMLSGVTSIVKSYFVNGRVETSNKLMKG
jgi:hypothetical protein